MTRILTFLSLSLLLAGAAPSPAEAQSAQPESSGDDRHLIRPGDIVRLDVWREPEFSGEFQVDEGGSVTLPRLGRIQVTGYSPASLESELIERFSETLRNPSIGVVVLRRIRIKGEVNAPGLYPVDPTMSVADAVALAGGVTPRGNNATIQLWRDGRAVELGLDSEATIGESPIRSGDQIVVPERSWLSRNTNVVAASIGAAASIIIALFIR
ncbi:MAG: polysaccharide biosynthesis/export family protein [Gemmatimonadetes bacterium]|nr:polysaccharide biosynthesis/export family protein [Gemmatimonadota bacterium]